MGIAHSLKRALGLGLGRKNFQGDLFGRFQGLEPLFERAAGRSVLDLGMSEGHIGYEFARHGASAVHGLEQHRDKVRFAERLFRDVAIDTRFQSAGPVTSPCLATWTILLAGISRATSSCSTRRAREHERRLLKVLAPSTFASP